MNKSILTFVNNKKIARLISISLALILTCSALSGCTPTIKKDSQTLHWKQVQSLDAKSKELLDQGTEYLEGYNYEQAIKYLNYFIKLNPKVATGYYNLGVAYSMAKNYTGALEAWEKAISIDKDYADAYYNLGLAYKFQRNNKKAVENYAQFLILNPEYENKNQLLDEISKIREPNVGHGVIGRVSMTDTADYSKNIGFSNKIIFDNHAKNIYSCIELINAAKGTRINANWYYYTDGEPVLVNSARFKTSGSRNLLIKLSKPNNKWPEGKYEFELSINGKTNLTVPFYVNL